MGRILTNMVNINICEGILMRIFLRMAPVSVRSSSGRMSPRATVDKRENSKYRASTKLPTPVK